MDILKSKKLLGQALVPELKKLLLFCPVKKEPQ